MLTLNNVEVNYHEVILAVRGISLEVPDGKIVALLGSNGAGKTTTLKAISGLLKLEAGRVTNGTIEFGGMRLENGNPEETYKKGIAQVMEGRRVFPQLTVEENLNMGAYLRSDKSAIQKDNDEIFGYFPQLKGLRKRKAGYLSGGEQQMLVIGRSLIARPKLILLDEPSLGLAPLMVREIFDIIKKINAEREVAILLVEQNAVAALGIATYGYVLEIGKLVLGEPAEKMVRNEDVREFYLGLSRVGEKKSYKDVKHYRRRKTWLS
jgi:branched-chain amino acid transport system ATP-binding protein